MNLYKYLENEELIELPDINEIDLASLKDQSRTIEAAERNYKKVKDKFFHPEYKFFDDDLIILKIRKYLISLKDRMTNFFLELPNNIKTFFTADGLSNAAKYLVDRLFLKSTREMTQSFMIFLRTVEPDEKKRTILMAFIICFVIMLLKFAISQFFIKIIFGVNKPINFDTDVKAKRDYYADVGMISDVIIAPILEETIREFAFTDTFSNEPEFAAISNYIIALSEMGSMVGAAYYRNKKENTMTKKDFGALIIRRIIGNELIHMKTTKDFQNEYEEHDKIINFVQAVSKHMLYNFIFYVKTIRNIN